MKLSGPVVSPLKNLQISLKEKVQGKTLNPYLDQDLGPGPDQDQDPGQDLHHLKREQQLLLPNIINKKNSITLMNNYHQMMRMKKSFFLSKTIM